MILNCPKCKKQFPLSDKCFASIGRIDLTTEYMACTQCGFVLPAMEFVGQIRCGEFLNWINGYNDALALKKRAESEKPEIPKSLWDVVVADSALRKILISEEKLTEKSGSPSIRFIVRSSSQPSRDFILGKFKEHLNEVYQHGYIDPFIQCTCMCIAADGRFFDI